MDPLMQPQLQQTAPNTQQNPIVDQIISGVSSLAPEELEILNQRFDEPMAMVLVKILGEDAMTAWMQALQNAEQANMQAQQSAQQPTAGPPPMSAPPSMSNSPIPPEVRQDVVSARENVPIPPSVVDLHGGNNPPAR